MQVYLVQLVLTMTSGKWIVTVQLALGFLSGYCLNSRPEDSALLG